MVKYHRVHIDIKFSNIIAGCIRQERKMQSKLYELYYAYGMSICIRYVNHENEAISILNDSFMKVFKEIRKYETDKPFKPWLRRILINTALNEIKKNQKFTNHIELEAANFPPLDNHILSSIQYQELITLIQTLPPAYRTVFNLYVIDGFKHKEISNQLGINEGTSKSNLKRARIKLIEKINNKQTPAHVK